MARELETALNNLENTINQESKKTKKIDTEKFKKKCMHITFPIAGKLGVNFYVYTWIKEPEKLAVNSVTDLGCDNYKGIDYEQYSDNFMFDTTDFYTLGAENLKDCIEKINKLYNTVGDRISDVNNDFKEFIKSLDEISSELESIDIPNMSLSADFKEYKDKFEKIRKELYELIYTETYISK